jgi:hypothetical protein
MSLRAQFSRAQGAFNFLGVAAGVFGFHAVSVTHGVDAWRHLLAATGDCRVADWVRRVSWLLSTVERDGDRLWCRLCMVQIVTAVVPTLWYFFLGAIQIGVEVTCFSWLKRFRVQDKSPPPTPQQYATAIRVCIWP